MRDALDELTTDVEDEVRVDPYDDGTGEIVWWDTRDRWQRYWAGDYGPEPQRPGYDEWDAWEQAQQAS